MIVGDCISMVLLLNLETLLMLAGEASGVVRSHLGLILNSNFRKVDLCLGLRRLLGGYWREIYNITHW